MKALEIFIENTKIEIKKSKFAKRVIVITGGAAITQLSNLFFSPIVTRIYTPEEYGVMAVFSSILMILSFSSLKYEMAIPIDKDDSQAFNTFVLSIIILTLFTLSLTLLILLRGNYVLSLFDAETLLNYKYFIPFGVFLVGFHKILTQWMYRRKKFDLLSQTRVGQNISGNIIKILTGILGFGVSGLLLGKVVSESVSILPLGHNILNKEKNLKNNISKNNLLRSFKKHKDFPIYQTPSSFLSSFKNQVPIFSLALYGSQVVGFYGLANSLVKLPMTLIGHSVRNVFYAEAASIGKDKPEKLKKLSDNLLKKMIIIGLFPLGILIIFGPQLFSLVFGNEWVSSGIFARSLSLAIYADFIFSPVSRIYEVLERQKEKLYLDIAGLLLVLLSFSLSRIISESPYLAITLYSISMFIIYFTNFIFARIFMNHEIKNTTRRE